VPGWLFLWGGAVVVVLSFVLLAALWRRPQLERRAVGRPLPVALERILRSTTLRVLLGAVSAALLVLVFATALVGEPSSAENLAPTFVLVIFWLGLVPVQVLLGDVWPALNPWLAFANGVSWLSERLGRTWTPPLNYPERLGVWPAAALLFCFTTLELVYAEPGNPRALALAIALYSYTTWFGMAAFGRRAWTERGEAFTVYFGLFARIAPFGERDGRLVVRMPFSGLAGRDPRPGLVAFVAVMLGSVGFDGIGRSPFWQDLRADVEGPYVLDSPGTAELVSSALAFAGLLACVLIVAIAYLAATRGAQLLVERAHSFEPEFVRSLVPVALVYAIAHYFTALLVNGQDALRLASDPFGYGWDLFGTTDFAPNIAPLSPNNVWYVQIGVLVAGHVAGLAVAHDRAITLLPERDALRSQYAMLALMVFYTIGGMWILTWD
jgi:hypothetical protein